MVSFIVLTFVIIILSIGRPNGEEFGSRHGNHITFSGINGQSNQGDLVNQINQGEPEQPPVKAPENGFNIFTIFLNMLKKLWAFITFPFSIFSKSDSTKLGQTKNQTVVGGPTKPIVSSNAERDDTYVIVEPGAFRPPGEGDSGDITTGSANLPASNGQLQIDLSAVKPKEGVMYGCYTKSFEGIICEKSPPLDKKVVTYENLDKCVQSCILYEKPCATVNFLPERKQCARHEKGVANLQEAKASCRAFSGAIYVKINCDRRLTLPLLCGVQAPQFQPINIFKSHRIWGGSEANAHSWPWQLIITGFTDPNIQPQRRKYCGGVLLQVKGNVVWSDIIVTTATCVTMSRDKQNQRWAFFPGLEIFAGTHSMKTYNVGEVKRVPEIIGVHMNFSFDTYDYDIAVVKLNYPFYFTDTIRPICLPTPEEVKRKLTDKTCVTTGWGETANAADSKHASVLQQLVTPVRSPSECNTYPGNKYSKEKKLCAGIQDSDGKKKGACWGDHGGPLQCVKTPQEPWKLFGLPIYINSLMCQQGSHYPRYTRINLEILDWIHVEVGLTKVQK